MLRSIIVAISALGLATTTAAQLCVGQGQGSCQGTYFCADNAGCNFWIYNHNCDLIGYKVNPQPGDAVFSQLPYSVVLDSLWPGHDPGTTLAGFRYAGGAFGWGNGNYVQGDCSGEVGGSRCGYARAAFPDGAC